MFCCSGFARSCPSLQLSSKRIAREGLCYNLYNIFFVYRWARDLSSFKESMEKKILQ